MYKYKMIVPQGVSLKLVQKIFDKTKDYCHTRDILMNTYGIHVKLDIQRG